MAKRNKKKENEVERLIKKRIKEETKGVKDKDAQRFYERNIRDDIEYENSFEGVLHNLRIWGEATTEDKKNKGIIVETLLKLPYKVRKKALDEVVFVIMAARGWTAQHVFPVTVKKSNFKQIHEEYYHATIKQPFIYLNFKERMSKSRKMDIITHEIAHFILEHHTKTSKRLKQKENTYERKADYLSEKWGFKRYYKGYDF